MAEGLMKAVVIESYGEQSNIVIKQVPIPIPRRGEVLVRIEAAPINPSDLGFLTGSYQTDKKPPVIPGFEGSGVVVRNGGGFLGWTLVGKRVSCVAGETTDGTWAEYMVTNATSCIKLPDDVSFEHGSCCVVNPLTAVAFVDTIEKGKHQAAIQTAAASALGKMFIRSCSEKNIQLINVVRRPEQVEDLKAMGCPFVLNSNDEGFEARLADLATRLNATVAFEAVCGEITGQVLHAMPPKSIMYVYGSLSLGAAGGIHPQDFLFHGKQLEGLWLSEWVKRQSIFRMWRATSRIAGQLNTTMNSTINTTMQIESWKEAWELYQSNMSAGKLILKPATGN